MTISKAALALGLAVCTSLSAPALAKAAPPSPAFQPQANLILVADGCGYGRYRGPGGACHRFGMGPYPNGYFGPYQQPAYEDSNGWNGCPAGYWRGPWGHCRDTPYHGRLPNGEWQ
jgi:hypothetical protein